jgi:glutamate-1-semialdehyde 2,1-aminomutase
LLTYLSQHPGAYDCLNELTDKLEAGIKNASRETGVHLQVNRYGSMINPFFTSTLVVNYDTAQTCNTGKFTKFFWHLTENGVFIPPSQFEAWFVSMVLTTEDIQKTVEVIGEGLKIISGN